MHSVKRNTSRILLGTIVIPLVLLFSTASIVALADEKTPEESYDTSKYDEDGNLKIGKCFAEGGQSFMTFLQSTIWSDSFAEGIVEPWDDVLVRNSCHAYDILGLVQKRDKIRQQLRDALLTCRNEKVPQLKAAYYKTSVEIYYARNIVTGLVVKTYADLNALHVDMTEKYVTKNSWFTEDGFKNFLNELDVRYAERKAAYKDSCDMTSWKDVKKKFEEFINGGFAEDIKKSGAQLKRKAQKIEQAFGDANSWKEWAKGLAQVNINNQDPSVFGEEFVKEFKENNPFTKTNFPSTTQGAFENIQKSDLVMRAAALETEMSTRFQMLYGVGSDSNIQGFMDSAYNLDQTVLNSFPWLDGMAEGAKSIEDRQCS